MFDESGYSKCGKELIGPLGREGSVALVSLGSF